jgi:hypothetical protein
VWEAFPDYSVFTSRIKLGYVLLVYYGVGAVPFV